MKGKFSELETNCEKENIIDVYTYRKECMKGLK